MSRRVRAYSRFLCQPAAKSRHSPLIKSRAGASRQLGRNGRFENCRPVPPIDSHGRPIKGSRRRGILLIYCLLHSTFNEAAADARAVYPAIKIIIGLAATRQSRNALATREGGAKSPGRESLSHARDICHAPADRIEVIAEDKRADKAPSAPAAEQIFSGCYRAPPASGTLSPRSGNRDRPEPGERSPRAEPEDICPRARASFACAAES